MQQPKMVVKVEFHNARGEVSTFGDFEIFGYQPADRDVNPANRGDYIAKFYPGSDEGVVVRNYPRWLPIWHLLRALLNKALPADYSDGSTPEGWSESGRPYEVYCPHGVGHYTGNGGIHGCDGCCGAKNLPSFYPEPNYPPKPEEEEAPQL